jgi:hypothetical protein
MSQALISAKTLKELADAGAVRRVTLVGTRGGWALMARYGTAERTLQARRGHVRIFRTLDSAARAVRDLGLDRAEVDMAGYEPGEAPSSRPDRAEALKRAHQAAEHDRWFRERVAAGLQEADQPDAVWHDQDDVMAETRAMLEELAKEKPTSAG